MWRPSGDQSGIAPGLVTAFTVPLKNSRQLTDTPFETSRCCSSGENEKKFAVPVSGPALELTEPFVATSSTVYGAGEGMSLPATMRLPWRERTWQPTQKVAPTFAAVR